MEMVWWIQKFQNGFRNVKELICNACWLNALYLLYAVTIFMEFISITFTITQGDISFLFFYFIDMKLKAVFGWNKCTSSFDLQKLKIFFCLIGFIDSQLRWLNQMKSACKGIHESCIDRQHQPMSSIFQ